jgi:hypothetical protein
MFKEVSAGIGGVVLAGLAVFALSLGGYGMYKFFAPRYTAVDNEVYHNSQQYNDGMVRDLSELQLDYVNADEAHKELLRGVILDRFATYDVERLPPRLRNFYNQLQSAR